MSFSYAMGANATDIIRLLISDTNQYAPDGVTRAYIFEDEEIATFIRIQAMTFQSAQFYYAPSGSNLPASPVSYLRVAALALDALANNKARLSSIQELLDVKMDASKAAKALHDQAAAFRQVDDESGAFVVIEMVNTSWSFKDRYWAQTQRQTAM